MRSKKIVSITNLHIEYNCWNISNAVGNVSVNLKIRKSKCEFGRNEIEFLGYRLNEKGIFLDKKRIEAILLMPKPRNASEVKIWLGTLQMLKKFDF